jgi:hypothetical protein
MTDLEKYAVRMITDLNNTILATEDLERGKMLVQIYYKMYNGLPKFIKTKLDLPKPVPYEIKRDVLMEAYKQESDEGKLSVFRKLSRLWSK